MIFRRLHKDGDRICATDKLDQSVKVTDEIGVSPRADFLGGDFCNFEFFEPLEITFNCRTPWFGLEQQLRVDSVLPDSRP